MVVNGHLAVLVPSRGRPDNIGRLLDAMDATCRGATDLIVGVDEDDPTLAQYARFRDRCEVVVRRGMRGRLVRWLNVLASARARDYPYLGHIGDDNLPRTVGWDVDIMASLERQAPVGFCYGDDLDPGRPKGSLALTCFMTSAVVRKLGYMAVPRLRHMYPEVAWYAWGERTSMEFLPDVVLEHMHYSLGKSQRDESYEASTALIPQDCDAYNEYCEDPGGMNHDIARLGGRPFTVDELAAFNRGLNIPRRWGAAA